MNIVRLDARGEVAVVGKRCDRCRSEARPYRSLDDEFELCEFVVVTIHAGYGATAFADGDVWETDLCQRCARAVLGPWLRLTGSGDHFGNSLAARSGAPDVGGWRVISSIID